MFWIGLLIWLLGNCAFVGWAFQSNAGHFAWSWIVGLLIFLACLAFFDFHRSAWNAVLPWIIGALVTAWVGKPWSSAHYLGALCGGVSGCYLMGLLLLYMREQITARRF